MNTPQRIRETRTSHSTTGLLAGVAAAWCAVVLAAGVARAADWPQWRGPDRTDLSAEKGLLKAWPAGGPKRVWMYDKAGVGYAGPAIVGGHLFTLGTREVAGKNQEVVLCLDAATGKELWVGAVAGVFGNNWGDGPRGTPTVSGDLVYALGGQGTLVCLSAKDGKKVWSKTMQELGGKTPDWGYTESVLVDGDRVICTPGGDEGTMAALDRKTGAVVWRSKQWTDGAQYASPIVATHGGVKQYIQLTMQNVAGVSAADGKLLWKAPFPGKVAVIPTPIYRDGQVYVTAGYGVGCMSVKLGAGAVPTKVYENKVMKNHHGGVILLGDHLFGHSDGAGWVCQDFATGKETWSHRGFGKGAIGYADGCFYVLEEDSGTVALIEASTQGWAEKGRFKLDPQTTLRKKDGRIWTHPVICNGYLYLRDQDHLYCYRVKP